MKSKGITILLGIIIVAILVVFYLPLISTGTTMQVTFYDDAGEAVGHPLSLMPLGTVTFGGVEVSDFDIQVNFQTTNPNCNFVKFTVMLSVYRVASDNPMDPQFYNYWDGVLWESHVNKNTQPDIWNGGHLISPKFDVAVYCSDVPEDVSFTMEFSGNWEFWTLSSITHADDLLLASGEFVPAPVQLETNGYEYIATLGLPF